ncbi:MAG: YggT family protein [Gemmatimonadaceae bacterium]
MREPRENVTATEVTIVRPAYSVRAEQAVWLITGLVDALLIIRFAFKLLGASTQASFVSFLYEVTQLLVAPFHGIFNTAASGRYIFEPESLVAIAIYSLIGWGLASLVRVITRGNASRA